MDLILLALGISLVFFAPMKALKWSKKIFSWAKKSFNSLVKKASKKIVGLLDTILYELLKKYNSVGKVKLTISAALVANYIEKWIDFSPGKFVANLIDRFDKDGKTGWICF